MSFSLQFTFSAAEMAELEGYEDRDDDAPSPEAVESLENEIASYLSRNYLVDGVAIDEDGMLFLGSDSAP